MEPYLPNPALNGNHEIEALRGLYFLQKQQAVERVPSPIQRPMYLDIAHTLFPAITSSYGKNTLREQENPDRGYLTAFSGQHQTLVYVPSVKNREQGIGYGGRGSSGYLH